MNTTVEAVRPETLHKLAALALANGYGSIDEFVARVLPAPAQAGQAGERPFYETATADEWVREFRAWAASHDPNLPALTLEDVSRESIYHDQIKAEANLEVKEKTMNATITITLPAELEQIVSAKAAANGKGLEEYTLSVLRKDAELPSLRDLFADVRAEFEARSITDEELEQDIDAAVAEVRARHRA